MPFYQLVNEQQVEIVVAGPGDINRHYVCKGLAMGNFSVNVGQGYVSQNDTWQFEVGPQLDSTQFRRAIATVGFAGLTEERGTPQQAGTGNINWAIQTVFADFDDDAGKVRVSVTNLITLNSLGPGGESAGENMLSYDVSILAAVTGA